jgi:hypothetical protein
MQRFIVISTTAICAAVLSASPISVNWPAGKAVSVTQDKANAKLDDRLRPASRMQEGLGVRP